MLNLSPWPSSSLFPSIVTWSKAKVLPGVDGGSVWGGGSWVRRGRQRMMRRREKQRKAGVIFTALLLIETWVWPRAGEQEWRWGAEVGWRRWSEGGSKHATISGYAAERLLIHPRSWSVCACLYVCVSVHNQSAPVLSFAALWTQQWVPTLQLKGKQTSFTQQLPIFLAPSHMLPSLALF